VMTAIISTTMITLTSMIMSTIITIEARAEAGHNPA